MNSSNLRLFLRRHVLGLLAIFIAFSGTAIAAGGSGPTAKTAVVTDAKFKKLKKRVTALEQKASPTTLPPSGPAGGNLTGSYPNPTLASGVAFKNVVVRESVSGNIATNNHATADIQCQPGETAVGGGVLNTIVGTRNFAGLDIDSRPEAFGPIDAAGHAAVGGTSATGWHMSAQVLFGPRDLHFYVLCGQK